jgi:hypothetical protein
MTPIAVSEQHPIDNVRTMIKVEHQMHKSPCSLADCYVLTLPNYEFIKDRRWAKETRNPFCADARLEAVF